MKVIYGWSVDKGFAKEEGCKHPTSEVFLTNPASDTRNRVVEVSERQAVRGPKGE